MHAFLRRLVMSPAALQTVLAGSMRCHCSLTTLVGWQLLLQLVSSAPLQTGDQNKAAGFVSSLAAAGASRRPQLLYPLEYDTQPDWELVPYDSSSGGGVSWMMALKDRLTVSRKLPLGKDLTVVSAPAHILLASNWPCGSMN